jgi:hypothetical protein
MLPQEKCRTKASLARHLQAVELFTVIDCPTEKCPVSPAEQRVKAYSLVNKTERRWRKTRGTPEGWEQDQSYSEYILISQQGITAR